MAIGARILSENLSGKTATVTFTPYTGTTSGTTVNLGTRTIPFNNITTHPYGSYAIYLAEYDYTYTLTIPEPVIGKQLFVITDRMVNSNNYGAAVLNFTDFTAEVIDLGVDSTYWYNENMYPLQNSGYMYVFGGQSNNDEKLVIFTDVSGLEIDRYTGTTNNYSADSLDGRVLTFEDGQNGVLAYSNGTSVHTYSWDPQTHYIDIEWDWYAVTSDNTFIIKKREEGQWNFNGNGESYLVNTDNGTTTLFKTWSDADATYVRHKMQPNTDFIVVETQDLMNNAYTNLEIYDTSGTVLETVPLTGDTYNSRNDQFLGSTKYCVTYYNYNDNNIDYKIIHYNGETTTLTQTSHVRGANYESTNMLGDDDFWSNSSDVNGGVVISFYHQFDYSSVGYVLDYCDFIYMLNGQTSFNTYEVANNNVVAIEPYGQLSNIYRTKISTGDFFEILTISTTGETITTTEIPMSGITNINVYYLGERTMYGVLTNDNYDITTLLINEDGSIADTLSKTLVSQYNYSMNSQRNLGYMKFALSGGDEGYYVYSGSTGFTSTDVYGSVEYGDEYYSDNFLDAEIMFLYNEGGLDFRVLSSTGITSNIQSPNYNNRNIRGGKNKTMMIYIDSSTNLVNINLYGISGELLISTGTTYSNWDETYGINDRFVVKFNGDGVNEYFLVSEESITSVTLQNNDTEWAPNDYNWWDDY